MSNYIELIQQLISVGDGSIAHIYAGSCPDTLEGEGVRDPECPACQVLTRAALAAPQQEPVTSDRLLGPLSVEQHAECLVMFRNLKHTGETGALETAIKHAAVCAYVRGAADARYGEAAPPPPAAPALSDEEILEALCAPLRHYDGKHPEHYVDLPHWNGVEEALLCAGRALLAKVRP